MELSVPRYIPPPTNNRRVIGFGIVVALHVVVIYVFASGLAQLAIDKMKGPMETRIIEEAKQETEEPPPPPPKFQAPPPVFVAMPDVAITEPVVETSAIQNTTNQQQRPVAPPPPVVKDVIIPPRSNPRRPNTGPEDIYPAMSRRLGEEGTVVLLLTVNEEGRVTDAKVQTTSGFDRLDEAASKEAIRSWHFLPGTINGKPAVLQTSIRVTFKIQK